MAVYTKINKKDLKTNDWNIKQKAGGNNIGASPPGKSNN